MLYYVARVMSPDFLKKCQMQPISQDQWQIAKFILEFKSTHPTGIIFDGFRIGWIFSLLKNLFHNVFYIWPYTSKKEFSNRQKGLPVTKVTSQEAVHGSFEDYWGWNSAFSSDKKEPNYTLHNVSFSQIHSGGNDDDACLMRG